MHVRIDVRLRPGFYLGEMPEEFLSWLLLITLFRPGAIARESRVRFPRRLSRTAATDEVETVC